MGRLRLHILASGSKGNAAIVEDSATGEGFLIDCGLCKRDFMGRAAEAGFDVRRLRGIVITHAHSDHTKCLGVVLRGLAKEGVYLPLYAHPETVRESDPVRQVRDDGLCDVRPMAAGDAISLAGMQVHPFATSHDAAVSFGFRVECSADRIARLGCDAHQVQGEGNAYPMAADVSGEVARSGASPLDYCMASADALGYLTDSGHVPGAAHEALSGVRLLALESNHDLGMLKTCGYPYYLQQRIASDQGHLSNDQAAAELERLLHNGLEAVAAMHVSQESNTYGIPCRTLGKVLDREEHPAHLHVAYQQQLVSVG